MFYGSKAPSHRGICFTEQRFVYMQQLLMLNKRHSCSLAQTSHQLTASPISAHATCRASVCKHLYSKWDQHTNIIPWGTDIYVGVRKLFTKTSVPQITSASSLLTLPAAPASHSGLIPSSAWLRSAGVRVSASNTCSQCIAVAVEGIFNC